MKKRFLSLTLACLAVSTFGCNANYTQVKAREEATKHSCDWYQKCGEIGTGKTYVSLDDCTTTQAAFWNDQWKAGDCDNRITPAALNSCLAFIDNGTCGDYFQHLVTVLSQCSEKRVCNAGADGG